MSRLIMSRCSLSIFLSVFAAIFFSILGFPSTAQTPGFPCSRATQPLEVTICDSFELSALDRELNRLHARMVAGRRGAALEAYLFGANAWRERRNRICQTAATADYNCLLREYTGRIAALEKILTGGRALFQLEEPLRWVQLASRTTLDEARELADTYQRQVGDTYSFKVILSDVGWYAVSIGPLHRNAVDRAKFVLSRRIWNFDPETFAHVGRRYRNILYSARNGASFAATGAGPPSTPRGQDCTPESVATRQAACFIYVAGAAICHQQLGRRLYADLGRFGSSLSAGTICNAAATQIQNGRLSQQDLIASTVFVGIGAVGDQIMQDAETLGEMTLGFLLSLADEGYALSLAMECAALEAANCGY